MRNEHFIQFIGQKQTASEQMETLGIPIAGRFSQIIAHCALCIVHYYVTLQFQNQLTF